MNVSAIFQQLHPPASARTIMRSLKVVNSSALLLVLVLQCSGVAAQYLITKDEFYPVLTDGYQDAWVSTSQTERDTGQPTIQELESNGRIPVTGGWQLTIVHACPLDGSDNNTSNNYGKVMTYTNFAYVLNHGDRMEFLFESQDVNTAVIDAVDSALDKRRKELAGEFKDVEVTLSKQENGKFALVAIYPYFDGITGAALRSRIGYFLSASGFTMCDIFTASEQLSWNRLKSLLKSDIQLPLVKADFTALYPLFQDPDFETESDGPEGNWSVAGDDDGNYGILVENFGDLMKLWVRVSIDQATGLETFSEESSEVVEREIRNQVKPWKKAPDLEAMVGESNLWVGFVFPYAGMKGNDVADLLEAFIHKDGAEGVYKSVKKIMKTYGE